MCVTGLPVAVEPSPNLQAKRYGVVPPAAVAMKVTGLPTMGDVGPSMKPKVRGSGMIVMDVDAVAVLCTGVDESVAVTLIV